MYQTKIKKIKVEKNIYNDDQQFCHQMPHEQNKNMQRDCIISFLFLKISIFGKCHGL